MSDPGESLVKYTEPQAAIEPYIAGGIIEHAIGMPQQSMVGIVKEHLDTIAKLALRGDTVQERPTYVFNPDTGLLINYAFRRHSDPAREGLFADVVELDTDGNPRHGVEMAKPFATETGFIQVAVGENDKGFAPSNITMKLEDTDLATATPPNIEMADLLALLQNEPIPQGMELDEFLAAKRETRDELRAKANRRQRTSYLGSEQAIDSQTDPNLHLIITDREDYSALEEASREVGVFPVVLTAQEMVSTGVELREMGAPHAFLDKLNSFVRTNRGDNVRGILSSRVPAFMTCDFESMIGLSYEERERKMVPFPKKTSQPVEAWFGALSFFEPSETRAGIFKANPIFSKLTNERLGVEEDEPQAVAKLAHGRYEMADPTNAVNIKTYTDWLRKARLDYALTLYLRGLSQL